MQPTDEGPAHSKGVRAVTDGGSNEQPEDDEAEEAPNLDVKPAGEAEPADPKWEPPDLDDIPEFEVRADEPIATDHEAAADPAEGTSHDHETGAPDAGGAHPGGGSGTNPDATVDDPTAGRPHDAQAPGATAVSTQETEAYIAALEICTRLPDEVRLPDEAADLVPTAVEAELEQDIQQFAAAEFDNARPHVDVLSFDEIEDEIWLRIRIGIPAEGFRDLDPEALRSYALQQLEGVF